MYENGGTKMTTLSQRFYKSKAWYQCRGSYIKKVDYICERCGRVCYTKGDNRYKEAKRKGQDVVFGIVHHKVYIDAFNINDPYITLSHDNLEYLCINCHNKEHMSKDKIRDGVMFNEDGSVVM